MRKLLCTLLILTTGLLSKAQDPNFSQFFVSPLTLNPALTGKFDGVFRIAGNYRNQWPSINNAFTTYTASVDAGILRNRIPEFDKFGIGFLALSDKSGDGVLQNNYAALSLSYHKALDENGFHQIGLGFQGAYVNKNLDITKVKFQDQLTANGFTGVTSEIFNHDQLSISMFDMNAGILYNGTTNGSNNIYFGASGYHLNRAKETFQGGQYTLQPRLTLQAGGMLPIGESNAFHFSTMYSSQAGATNMVLGGAYMINVNADEYNPTNLYLGTWARFNNVSDAVIPYIGLEFSSLRFGLSYDVNISSLKPASNMKGGAEISLIYIKAPSDPNAKKLNCPKF